MIHEVGGLVYYDGANLNAIMGIVRPGDMGFDVIHLNLHKTFSTPHGGGGPGSGPVGCKDILADYLPEPCVKKEESKFYFEKENANSIGRVKEFYGNFLVVVRALTYITSLGSGGIKETAENAVLNANYMMSKLSDLYPIAYEGPCMHEFVISIEELKREKGISALDIAKALLDYGIHPPTMYFPMIVHEALMVDTTESESKDTIDQGVVIFRKVYEKAINFPEQLHEAPILTLVGRLDEVGAARNPKPKYIW
jgi:glycine dehydrogenase subunit 2